MNWFIIEWWFEWFTHGSDDSHSQEESFREVPINTADIALIDHFKNWKVDARLSENILPIRYRWFVSYPQVPVNFLQL